MRGYLKTPGHSYILDEDVISIGKGSDNKLIPPVIFKNARAHIPISSGKADPHHAVVVKQSEKSFFLTDLNTAYGTYVNEIRIQNNTVELKPGDQIRFGYGGVIYEFGLLPNGNTHDNFAYNNTQINETQKFSNQPRPVSAHSSSSTLINYTNITRPDTAPQFQNMQVYKVVANKRAKSVPINMRTATIKYGDDTKTIISDKETEDLPPVVSQEEWSVDGKDINDFFVRDRTYSKDFLQEKEQNEAEPWYVSMLREKEQRLLHMGEEISRLTITNNESKRKDDIINDLRNKIANLDLISTNLNDKTEIAEKNNEILQMEDDINRLTVYKKECERKEKLITTLQDQIGKLEVEKETLAASIEFADNIKTASLPNYEDNEEWKTSIEKQSHLMEHFKDNLTDMDVSLHKHQDELDEFRKQLNLPIPERRTPQEIIVDLVSEVELKEEEINQLKNELKEVQHEKNLSQGFSQALQREISRNENKILKLSTTLQKAEKEVKQANAKSQAMSEKFANLKEEIKHEEVVAVMEKNLNETQEKMKGVQQELSKQQYKADKQTKELKRANRQSKHFLEKEKTLQSQMESMQAELQDLRQKEQAARVLQEQTSSRLHKLRAKVIQSVYTAPGSIKPETKLDDTEILNSIQKIINDRSEFYQQLCDLGQQMPPLVMTLDMQSEDGSDADVPIANSEKKLNKGKKSARK